jgi:hypothetical protein
MLWPSPPGELEIFLEVGALGSGEIEVNAVATGAGAPPVSAGVTVMAAEGSGADVQIYPPILNYSSAFQYWLNAMSVYAVNAGPDAAHDVEVRFSGFGPPLTWLEYPRFTLYRYRDLGSAEDRDDVVCQSEPSTGDYVCLIPELDAWEEALIDVDWWTDDTGTVAFTVEAFSAQDPDLTNNATMFTLEVEPTPIADVSTSHRALTASPSVGSPLRFEWRLHNAGPNPATVLGFFGALGITSYEVVSAPTEYSCFHFGEVACYFYDLPPGETAVIEVEGQPTAGGDYFSYSQAIALFPERYDPDYSNNYVELLTPVTGRIPTITREVISLSGYMRIPCIPGDGYFFATAQQRSQENLKRRFQSDGTVTGFFHSNLAWRSDSGDGIVFTDDGDVLFFELKKGRQTATERLSVRKKSATDDVRFHEDYTWTEVVPDGTKGMTLSWRLTLRLVMDDLGRWVEVLDRADFECRR